ncbi:unnamed protein product [Urochloa decumbens]|uniref:Uncharacterized protein n=1 Tax=Urochloa decumbens TaxID=240449 RepID=A0ABC9B326_9POAL
MYESIAVVRKNTYEMMCKVSQAKDPSSSGKQISKETRKANGLIKTAEEKLPQIKALGGEALAIPVQFYLDVKPLKL